MQTRGDDPYYVKFATGPDGTRAEAVSNRFLDGWHRLDDTAERRLRRLGWRPPTDIGDGPANWWRAFPPGGPDAAPADLAVATLRKVFEVPRPAHLQYRAFSRSRAEILLPTLGLERARRPDDVPLVERVDAALRDLLGLDEVIHDSEGDFPIRSGDVMVYVRVVPDPGYVSVFSPVLLEFDRTPALVNAVNQVNRSIRVARASVSDDVVLISAEVFDGPEVGNGLVHAFRAVSSLSKTYGPDLRSRFGGRTFFEDPPTSRADRGRDADGTAARPGWGFYL